MPPGPDERRFFVRILNALGAPYRPVGNIRVICAHSDGGRLTKQSIRSGHVQFHLLHLPQITKVVAFQIFNELRLPLRRYDHFSHECSQRARKHPLLKLHRRRTNMIQGYRGHRIVHPIGACPDELASYRSTLARIYQHAQDASVRHARYQNTNYKNCGLFHDRTPLQRQSVVHERSRV
jgi:hypothetical protein